MQRRELIERVLRSVYGGQPADDSNITYNLVSKYISDGTAVAAKNNYKEAISMDGIGYVNNSFYSTFKGLVFTQDEKFAYVATLPQIPLGIGRNEGILSLRFKDSTNNVSYDALPLSENEWTYYQQLPQIPNKILYKPESTFIYALSVMQLTQMTANVTMISGGDDTDLDSLLNVPQDYIPEIFAYCVKMLTMERMAVQDIQQDGQDD